jgi:hypothetical protein
VVYSDPFYTQFNNLGLNPTNGSWWIVQIFSGKDLKYPPTAVGGITLSSGDVW